MIERHLVKCVGGGSIVKPLDERIRILENNGNGWYWELLSQQKGVIARGLALSEDIARSDAAGAAEKHEFAPPDLPALKWPCRFEGSGFVCFLRMFLQ